MKEHSFILGIPRKQLEEFFFSQASKLEKKFGPNIFTEKNGVQNFDEDKLIASLKKIVTEKEV